VADSIFARDGSASTDWRLLAVVSAALGLVIAAVWIGTLVLSEDGLVRVRNSMGAQVGSAAEFGWAPGDAPSGFLQLARPAPAAFVSVASGFEADGVTGPGREFAEGLAYARLLMSASHRVDGPVLAPSYETLLAIVHDGRGYCADFVKAFTGLASARGIAVRQWGIAFNGFGSGHTFNEVYDTGLRKWIMIDSFHSLYFVDPVSRLPLSTLEVHDRLLAIDAAPSKIGLVRIAKSGFPFRSDELALDYYRRGMSQLWMVWGNNLFDYESSFAGRLEVHAHRALGQFIGILTGDFPTIRIYPVGLSQRDYRILVESRNTFILSVVWLAMATFLALYVAVALNRSRRGHR
jgi:hypothetical protein